MTKEEQLAFAEGVADGVLITVCGAAISVALCVFLYLILVFVTWEWGTVMPWFWRAMFLIFWFAGSMIYIESQKDEKPSEEAKTPD